MRERKPDTQVKRMGKWKNDSKRRKKPADRVRKLHAFLIRGKS